MEEGRYWMCAKRKHDELIAPLSNNPPSSSWEEQAFAEDAAGILGGCVWPPRSYTCSFCRREFRSAQALGGHMNVHRRDRARLKQSPPNTHEHDQLFVPPNLNNHVLNPSQIPTFLYNPNSDTSVPIRASSQNTHSSFSSTRVKQQNYKNKLSSSPLSWSNLVADKYSCHLSNLKNEKNKLKSIDESIFRAKQPHVETDLSFNLNFVVCRNQEPNGTSVEEAVTNCKRRRLIEENSPFEELDLELRLGETPKVK